MSRMFTSLVATPIVTLFGLGKPEFGRPLWIGIATLLTGSFTLLISGGFKEDRSPLQWAPELLLASAILFILGWLTSTYYFRNNREHTDTIIIDKVAGQLLTLALCIPPLYAMLGILGLGMAEICRTYMVCIFWLKQALIFLVITALPLAIYSLFDHWSIWPKGWLETNWHNSTGMILDDLFTSLYVTLVVYCLLFIPLSMHIEFLSYYIDYTSAMLHYWGRLLLLVVTG